MTDKTELLRLADALDKEFSIGRNINYTATQAAAVLRKLAEQEPALQKAMTAPYLYNIGPAPRQDKVSPYAAPVPKE